jgi:DNA-directed RNA polymerase subunit M/transcription elongation factor TFIIS
MTFIQAHRPAWKRHETGVSAYCDKCGARRKPEVRYTNGNADKPDKQLGERVVCTCPECGFMWNERCVDAA